MKEIRRERSKSIFSNYYSACISIILVSLALLSLLTTFVSSYYFTREKLSSLSKVTNQINAAVRRDYYDSFGRFMRPSSVSDTIKMLAGTNEADVILLEKDGKIIGIASYNGLIDENINESYIGDEVFEKLSRDGKYGNRTKLNGIYSQKVFVAGSDIRVSDNVVGYVLVCAPSTDYTNFFKGLIKALMQCVFISLIVSFVFIYYSSDALSVPIKKISSTAESFAHGNLSARVDIADDSPTEIKQLANTFNDMADDLSLREKSSRAFIANVSHELKTPVTSISGFVDGILDGTIPQEQEEKYLKIVSSESKRLSRLVVTMLNMSRIEAGEMKPNLGQVDLSSLLINTVIGFEQQITRKNIEIFGLDELDKTYVNADLDLTAQVIYNLIENAVKFTPEHGFIDIKCKTDDAMMIETEIKNSGEGISDEDLQHLFDRFYKSDRSRSMDKTGVGLGLNIVKSLLQLQNGSIKVESEPGHYSSFIFCLPKYIQKNVPARFNKKTIEN